MEDNWYDTVVSDYDSNRVFSVVDWASDSPLPFYLPTETPLPLLESSKKNSKPKPAPEPVSEDATYLIFPWSINDPEEGDQTTVLESKSADKLASPYGWHSIPIANLPSGLQDFIPLPIPDKDEIVNFTTTLRNNVFSQENWEGLNEFVSNYRPNPGPSLDSLLCMIRKTKIRRKDG